MVTDFNCKLSLASGSDQHTRGWGLVSSARQGALGDLTEVSVPGLDMQGTNSDSYPPTTGQHNSISPVLEVVGGVRK